MNPECLLSYPKVTKFTTLKQIMFSTNIEVIQHLKQGSMKSSLAFSVQHGDITKL